MGWETPLKVNVKMIAAKLFEQRPPAWSMWVLYWVQCLWCHVAWRAGWGQGHPSTRCCTWALSFTQEIESSWRGVEIYQLSFCAVRMGQCHLPRFILTSTTEVLLQPSTQYCTGADWREWKILFHQVMTEASNTPDKSLKENTRTPCSSKKIHFHSSIK